MLSDEMITQSIEGEKETTENRLDQLAEIFAELILEQIDY